MAQMQPLDVLMPPYDWKLEGHILEGVPLYCTLVYKYLQMILTVLSLSTRGCCQRQNVELDSSLSQFSTGTHGKLGFCLLKEVSKFLLKN